MAGRSISPSRTASAPPRCRRSCSCATCGRGCVFRVARAGADDRAVRDQLPAARRAPFGRRATSHGASSTLVLDDRTCLRNESPPIWRRFARSWTEKWRSRASTRCWSGTATTTTSGDVPIIARDYVPGATIYVNDSGKHMLAGSPGLVQRVASVGRRARVASARLREEGEAHPVSRHPVGARAEPRRSSGSTSPGRRVSCSAPWSTPFENAHAPASLRVGTTFAFLIDFSGS